MPEQEREFYLVMEKLQPAAVTDDPRVALAVLKNPGVNGSPARLSVWLDSHTKESKKPVKKFPTPEDGIKYLEGILNSERAE